MGIKELLLLKSLDSMKEWVNKDWSDKAFVGKAECVAYIEVFCEAEEYIRDKAKSKELNDYIKHNYSKEDIKVIKRMYEETKYFVGFNSLEFNFFIDDLIDEIEFEESLKPEINPKIDNSPKIESSMVEKFKGIKFKVVSLIKKINYANKR